MVGLCYLLHSPERGVVPLDNVAVSDVLDSREGASHALLEHFREPCEHHLQHIAIGSIPHGPNREFEGLNGLEEVGLLEGADPLGHGCFESGLSHHIGQSCHIHGGLKESCRKSCLSKLKVLFTDVSMLFSDVR